MGRPIYEKYGFKNANNEMYYPYRAIKRLI